MITSGRPARAVDKPARTNRDEKVRLVRVRHHQVAPPALEFRQQGVTSVAILGMTVEKRNLREIRRKVGLVFQNPDDQLFCPTVFDDVATLLAWLDRAAEPVVVIETP